VNALAASLPVGLPAGRVEVSTSWEIPEGADTVVAVAHGAGAGMDHPFLVGFTDALNAVGLATVRFAFPYREAGRRMPGPAAHAVATWAAVADACRTTMPEARFVAAGKSYGGRMASMAASTHDTAEAAIAPDALVYLGYPLHPPGAPDKERSAHLPSIGAPQLFVEGTIDPFIQPIERFAAVVDRCARADVLWIEGGGHSFEVKGERRAADAVGAGLAAPVSAWLAA